MASKADYAIVQVDGDRVFIVDLDLGNRSVTNDADRIAELFQFTHPGKRLIYRDSMGRWDEMCITPDNVVAFRPYDEYVPDCEIASL